MRVSCYVVITVVAAATAAVIVILRRGLLLLVVFVHLHHFSFGTKYRLLSRWHYGACFRFDHPFYCVDSVTPASFSLVHDVRSVWNRRNSVFARGVTTSTVWITTSANNRRQASFRTWRITPPFPREQSEEMSTCARPEP